MRIQFFTVLLVIFTHFLFDWIFQSRETARLKSQNLGVLVRHVASVSIGFLLAIYPAYHLGYISEFAATLSVIAYGLSHAAIDWYLWRYFRYRVRVKAERASDRLGITPDEFLDSYLSNRAWAEDKTFYDAIAIDQFLHLSFAVGIIWLAWIF